MAGRVGRVDLDGMRRIAATVRRDEQKAPGPAPPAPGGSIPQPFRRFTLKEVLTPDGANPGATAAAYLVKYDYTEEKYVVDTDYEFDIRDPTGTLHGVAYDADNTALMVVGWAVKPFDCPEWEVMYLPEYQFCKAETTGAVVAADGTYTVDAVTVVFGANPVRAASDTLTVANIFEDDIDSGAVVTITYNASVPQWQTADVKCPA